MFLGDMFLGDMFLENLMLAPTHNCGFLTDLTHIVVVNSRSRVWEIPTHSRSEFTQSLLSSAWRGYVAKGAVARAIEGWLQALGENN